MLVSSVVLLITASLCSGASLLQAVGDGLRRIHHSDDVRIVGGVPATIQQYPWTASMQRFGSHRCGAAIISRTKMLTAAHCTHGITARSLQMRVGSTYCTNGGLLKQVLLTIPHPAYNPVTIANDISVVVLASPLAFQTDLVASVALPAFGSTLQVGELTSVVGWGTLYEGGRVSTELRHVSLPIISNDDCNRAYANGILDGMLCAGYELGEKDACQGDSGGPMTIDGTLVGIVSWGNGCARPGYPGVYTRVAEYRTWIDSLE